MEIDWQREEGPEVRFEAFSKACEAMEPLQPLQAGHAIWFERIRAAHDQKSRYKYLIEVGGNVTHNSSKARCRFETKLLVLSKDNHSALETKYMRHMHRCAGAFLMRVGWMALITGMPGPHLIVERRPVGR